MKPTRLRPQHRPERSAVPRLRRLALGAEQSRGDAARGLHDQPGCRRRPDDACTEAEANFGSARVPPHCPDNAKIGTFSIGTPALTGRLEGAVYIGEPKPGDQYRLFDDRRRVRDQRQAGRLDQTRPDDRAADGLLRRPAPGPVRRLPAPPLRLRSRPDGDPDRSARSTRPKADFFPWNAALAEQESTQIFGLEPGPNGSPLPRAGPAVQPAPRRRHLQPRSPAPSAPSR